MVGSLRKNKRGWIRILEATIAVMIVSGVLVVVYSRQVDRGIAPADYFFSLQRQILADISGRSDLRLAVLNVDNETKDDDNFKEIDDFIGGKVPEAFGYSLRVCDFGDEVDFCKMNADTYVSTRDKDVFVEEIIISSDLGDGSNVVDPSNAKKLRFFIWELR